MDLKRILWAQRRGMLELDLIIQRYITAVYEELTDVQRQHLELLLQENDQTLSDWLLSRSAPPEHFKALVRDMLTPT